MKKGIHLLAAVTILIVLAVILPKLNLETVDVTGVSKPEATASEDVDYKLYFPADRYPETAKHIEDAIAAGEPQVCTIDRDGAEENRKDSLKDVPTKKGYDRDEWPMAMCAEGGEGADIEYITPSDNRGAGAWVSNKLDEFPDGTRVEFIVR
ncbi:NucA/NucB deoxyribonuclease domain-containing protein [Paenibacillus sp. NEAU-GSW1]|uniref:NucA/NucB deoxyribonuclease domain-containing protein n=1 Tax=Paenibacillus sp. NEAU-GSW1 TaxID=2682486 RepID=UPI0012E2A761|nr:NucA/NucB deoxyribonuclease domain-containing protein [Paenibacillus sp. NEAU-GSW1]MUT67932.1 DNA-entry nuclease [Paenibacillus sp. NEAU-GSW1]